jgi:hypothetical protein
LLQATCGNDARSIFRAKPAGHAQLRVHATDEARSCFIPMPYIIPVFRTIFNGGLVFDFFLQNGGAL